MKNIIRVSESEDWIVDYDKLCGMYRVSYFQDNHFVDEHFFDAYEEKELERDIPKPVIRFKNHTTDKWSAGECPNCHRIIMYDYSVGNGEVGNRKCYCSKCGQLCDFEDIAE